MLLQLPLHLQAHIFRLLHPSDLARMIRISRRAHSVAVPILYEHVKLQTPSHVQSFFLFTTTFAKGSAAERAHAETKPAHWEYIQTLQISLPYRLYDAPTFDNLPRVLRQRSSNPFQLDVLQVSVWFDEDLDSLGPLLACFDPLGLGICHWGNRRRDSSSASSANASAVTFPGVDYATIVVYGALSKLTESSVRSRITRLLKSCPNAQGMEIVSSQDGRETDLFERVVQRGVAGKSESFFEVVERPDGANVWGEVVEDA